MALKNDGTVLAWGNNTYGQTNVTGGLAMVKTIAAGAYHSMAATFSTLIQYPIDVSKDVLLIYNTNSADSTVVKDYYLANRPLISGANVLGIACPTSYGCPTNETALPSEYTNQIQTPVLNWLSANPTKYPQYVILFLDIPARVNDFNQIDTNGFRYYGGSYVHASVSVQLRDAFPGWKPFITHLNMNGTNDCKAYIDKLAGFGATNSPGKLVISASAGANYGNTNFVLDNVRHGGTNNPPDLDYTAYGHLVSNAIPAIIAAGGTNVTVTYLDGIETNLTALPHITNAVNVAGYMCWGFHSQLGALYATSGAIPVKWTGNSSWYIIETCESFNGRRFSDSGYFLQWYSTNGFGGINYSNTPVGAVTHVDEPFLEGISDSGKYFGLWAGGKSFAISAWNSRKTAIGAPSVFQAVGDPLVTR
jgi:hypothetical protein